MPDAALVDEHVAAIERDGYTILEDVIDPSLVDALADDLARLVRVY
jgi:ectoine hydroxylase-related dioxygenase (phytanoyl-CoA dioxygenase family)